MKIAVFDFCDTLVNFQTADEYVIYAMERLEIKKKNFLMHIIGIIEKITRHKYLLEKKALLYHLKGQKREDLETLACGFYVEKIRDNLHDYVVEMIKKYEQKGYEIVVSSSGYSIYIKEFCKEFGIAILQANDFCYKGDYFQGKILGKDCRGNEKILRLEQLYASSIIEDTVAFSDSKSDLPLLKWASCGVVVSKHIHREWCENNNLKEIVLSECNK